MARNARAEVLRDLGRPDEALAALDATIERFPANVVARTARAHLLAQLGNLGDAEAMLMSAALRSQTRDDWIATHILAMARLRVGRVREALASFDYAVSSCPFADVRAYFVTARPLALIAEGRAREAAAALDELARDRQASTTLATNIILFQAHAHAEAGDRGRARALVRSAQVIDFAVARQRSLAAALTERYALAEDSSLGEEQAEQLNETIILLEMNLVNPTPRRLAA